MKLLSFSHQGAASWGMIAADGGVIDLGAKLPYGDLRSFIASGDTAAAAALAGAPADHAFDAVDHLPVIPNPDKIICVGLNYHDHIKETGREETPNPVLFARFAAARSAMAPT